MILDVEKTLEFRRFWCFDSPSVDRKKMTRLRSRTTGMVSWGAPKMNHIESCISENLIDMNAKEILKTNNNLKRGSAVCLNMFAYFEAFISVPTRREATSPKPANFLELQAMRIAYPNRVAQTWFAQKYAVAQNSKKQLGLNFGVV